MPSIGQRTLDVVNMFNSGMTVLEIAKRLEVTPSNVEERLRTYKRFVKSAYPRKEESQPTWTIEAIKLGFDRFISENGHLPTAYEIDDCTYLPSSRQLQRRFGGLSELREALGYGKLDFSSGDQRRAIVELTNARGADAEDKLELTLIDRFGPLYVHSECRFAGSRKRVDFVIYAKENTVAIDIFATNDLRTLVKNLDVKWPKYEDFPAMTPLFFAVVNDQISQEDINGLLKRSGKWHGRPNLHVVTVQTLLNELAKLEPLQLPAGYRPL